MSQELLTWKRLSGSNCEKTNWVVCLCACTCVVECVLIHVSVLIASPLSWLPTIVLHCMHDQPHIKVNRACEDIFKNQWVQLKNLYHSLVSHSHLHTHT